jgi:hypothetical protein
MKFHLYFEDSLNFRVFFIAYMIFFEMPHNQPHGSMDRCIQPIPMDLWTDAYKQSPFSPGHLFSAEQNQANRALW